MGLFDLFSEAQPAPLADELWSATISQLPFIASLTVDEQKRLKMLTQDFLAEKEFSTGGGLQLSDEICLSIAVQACLPILNLGLSAYRDWVGIVVYPDEFVVPRQVEDEDGVIHEYDDVISGEAWEGGPLIISWHDAQMAGTGYNVVIHEFAHKLDMLNGEADGTPALHSGISHSEWENTLLDAYDDFCQRVENDEISEIDPYASESPAEFFAVLSELFFEQPATVHNEYPAFFELLKRYYRQDPLSRTDVAV
jgi:Mlc titration factor MtfA (ptsG expression regulator)